MHYPKSIIVFIAILSALITPASSVLRAQTNFDDEILYIDHVGRIKTLDLNQSEEAIIDWTSDEEGFFDFAVGDFTGDGDVEIAAIKGEGVNGRLVVYDPVISPGSALPTARTPNRVPWKRLYEQELGFTPLIVGAGNLDDSAAEDEILVGLDIGGGRSQLLILKINVLNELQGAGAIEVPIDGVREPLIFERTWNSVSIGQIDGEGPDEIVLTDSTIIPDELQSTIAIYRVEELVNDDPFFKRGNSFASWRSTAIGDIKNGGLPEIVAIRKVNGGSSIPTVFFFEYDTVLDKILDRDDGCPDEPYDPRTCPDDVDSLFLSPRPAHVFLADINNVNNDGEAEIFFLRSVPNNSLARFFLVNRGTDIIQNENPIRDPATTHPLRSRDIAGVNDNYWNTGDGGDIDGDGRDELIIGRPNMITTYIFRNNDFPIFRQDSLNTGNLRIRAANLDRQGFVTEPEVIAETSGFQNNIAARGSLTFDIIVNSLGERPIATLDSPNKPDWLSTGSALPVTRQVPFTVQATIDATDLLPGSHQFELRTAWKDSTNSDRETVRTINFTVSPTQLDVSSPPLAYAVFPCVPSSIASQSPSTQDVSITGTAGITFTAQISPTTAGWLSIDKVSGTVPDTLDVTIDPARLEGDISTMRAEVLIAADERTGSGTGSVRSIPALLICAQSQVYQPLINQ